MAINNIVSSNYIASVVGMISVPATAYARVDIKYFIKPNGLAIQSDRALLVKCHLLTSDNLVTYIGRFVDNYSAGNQIYGVTDTTAGTSYVYSEPYRYCDSLGKTRKLGVTLYKSATFLAKEFPKITDNTIFINPLTKSKSIEGVFSAGDDKDSREGYEFNITASLESNTEDILIYSCEGIIDAISLTDNDPDSLNLSTTLDSLTLLDSGGTITMSTSDKSVDFKISIPKSRLTSPGITPIVLWNKTGDYPILKIILRNYTYTEETTNYVIHFYAVSSQYGLYKTI